MQHRKHRAFARCFHIFIIFFAAKSFKNSFFKKQFFPATGDIFEMQPVDFMNGCDSNAEAWVLHSCCYLAHLTSLSHLGKEKPEEANARLWRASASSGNRGPAGLRGLIIRLPTLRSLGIVRRFGRVSVPFTNEQCRIQERKVKNRKSPYLEVISSLQ